MSGHDRTRKEGPSARGSSRRGLGTIVAVNVLVLTVLLVGLEGLSSIIYNTLRGTPVRTALTPKPDNPYVDPYTGKPVRQDKMPGFSFLNERYVPDSIAEFYYANNNWVSPEALYTDSYGFIHNGDPNRDLTKPLRGGQRIFLFGGSSAAGGNSTSSNRNTITAFLERDLNRLQNTENQVVNAAVAGYESFRELVLAEQMIYKYDIDTLIFLDGRNDWYRGTTSNRFYPNFIPDDPESFDPAGCAAGEPQSFGDSLRSLAIWKLASNFKSRFLNRGPTTLHPVLNIVAGDKVLPYDGFLVNPEVLFTQCGGMSYRRQLTYRPEAVANYISNLRSMAGLCIGQKKRCIIALQPTLGYGSRTPTEEEALYLKRIPFENWTITQEAFYNDARREFNQLAKEFQGTGVEFIDLSLLFDGDSSRVFLDSIHYLDHGNCVLGAALAAQIVDGDWRKHQRPGFEDCGQY